jgi:hypothetical protein
MGSIINLQNDFCREVEELYKSRKDTTYVEVIVDLCEKHGIEPEAAAKLLSKPIKERLKTEGQQMNMVKKTSKLPL